MAHALDDHMAVDCHCNPAAGGRSAKEALFRWIGICFDQIWLWIQAHRQRRALGELNDHLLNDIGLTRATAEREAEKLFWE